MATVKEVMAKLKEKARPDQLDGMRRYGIAIDNRFGLSMPELRSIAKELGTDNNLALALWKTGNAEARIVAGMVGDPAKLTEKQMDDWVKDFDSWDVCDQVCGSIFENSPFAWKKVVDWSERDEEFVKRAAFALLASLAWHDKKASDKQFIDLMPVIARASTDERNFVKKAVNWALRNIGKRNPTLNKAALKTAREIQKLNSKSACWIAADAIRELESDAVQGRLRKEYK